MSDHFSLALGIGTRNRAGDWLEVFYPQPVLHPDRTLVETLGQLLGYTGGNQALDLPTRQCAALGKALTAAGFAELGALATQLQHSTRPLVATLLQTDEAPTTTPGAYLKLHLLSHRLVKPHEVVLAGLFPLLPNVAWTNRGAVDINEVAALQLEERIKGRMLDVFSVDKLPKLTDYVVPKGIHIADAARVRLGAYVGEGTVVLHEGSINFNAGTQGASTIDGCIASGVLIGADSKLAGGCSMSGDISNQPLISVGHHCVINSHAGVGISLGHRNTVEAGLWLTPDTQVNVVDDAQQLLKTVIASELALQDDLAFRRNPESGAVECIITRTE